MFNKQKIRFFLILLFCLFIPFITFAAGGVDTQPEVSLPNPLKTSDPNTLIGKVINSVLEIVGSLALVMFIYGGLVWMTAAGNSQKVEKGKDILIWATIGLVVIFSAYAMVRFVFTGLGVAG